MKEILHSSEEMKNFAKGFVLGLKPKKDKATIVGLYGELGSGKTNFTQAVAEELGVAETVVSPTFVIMKVYEIRDKRQEIREKNSQTNHISNLISHISSFKHLIHIDAYRLEKSSELLHLGWGSIIDNPENLVLIEWPEKVADIMPEHTKIYFTHISEYERGIEIVP